MVSSTYLGLNLYHRHKGDVISTANPGTITFTIIVINTECRCLHREDIAFADLGTIALLKNPFINANAN